MNKPFVWTYSKLKDFENCEVQFYHKHIKKDIYEEPSEALIWGNEVHKALEIRLKNNKPLPEGMRDYDGYVARLQALPGKVYGEQKLGLNENLETARFFGKDVWARAIADVAATNGKTGLVVDYKTGKRNPDFTQLRVAAAMLFAKFKRLESIKMMFIWLKVRKTDSDTVRRDELPELWGELLPRVNRMYTTIEAGNYAHKPSGLCNGWCPVKNCEYYEGDD